MRRPDVTVLEIGRDGAFDADAPSEKRTEMDLQASETLREKGNAAFQSKAFARAVTLYTHAIDANPHNHVLYSNRSAAHYQLKQFEQALADANETIARSPTWPKAYVRQAAAYEALAKWRDALTAYETIVTLNSDTAETKKAHAKIQQLQSKLSSAKPTDSPIQRGFLHQPKATTGSGIYAEKEDVVKPVRDKTTGATRLENDDERRWRYMLTRLKAGCNTQGVNASGERVVLDDGVFAKLLQQHEFQTLIYPGIPPDQLVHAPKNLQALLEDPWYEAELLELMPKVQTKAHSVLSNVKARGAAQGEIMDAATEQRLLPQVLQEAFGREVLAMVHRINYKKHVLLAHDARTLADPDADEATWDQLPSAFLDALFSHVPCRDDTVAGVAVLDAFMGDDWAALVASDAQRMVKNGLLLDTAASATSPSFSPVSSGKMRFVEQADCDHEYPAIAELLTKLHALPFEINAKRGRENAALCAQFAHSTAVHELRRNEQQRLRLDCGTGDKDNGFKLTCVYFLNGMATNGRELRMRTALEADARVQHVATCADRLVMFQSQRVFNEITTATVDDNDGDDGRLLYVAFWIHGRELR